MQVGLLMVFQNFQDRTTDARRTSGTCMAS